MQWVRIGLLAILVIVVVHTVTTPPTTVTVGGWVHAETGAIYEWFFSATALSDWELCKICSCGVDGRKCTCTSWWFYSDTGFNAAMCGNCALPPCGW